MPDGRKLVIAADPTDADFNVFFASTPVQAPAMPNRHFIVLVWKVVTT